MLDFCTLGAAECYDLLYRPTCNIASSTLIGMSLGIPQYARRRPNPTLPPLLWGLLSCLFSFPALSDLPAVCGSASSSETVTIHVPAAAGGGWDLTANVIRSVLLEEQLVGKVELVYNPGAGGLIGLAQFIEAQRGNAGALLVGGMFMIGSVALNQASISLLDATPIARLTTEPIVVAVPNASPIHSLDELIEIMLRRPALVSWVGGSLGGADQHVLLRLRQSLGIPSMPYHPMPGGGVADALADGGFTAGLSGYSELEPHIRSGRLRLLAVSADSPEPEIGVPTFKERGIDVSVVNWRGVFAAPSISKEQLSCWLERFSVMVATDAWRLAVNRHHWDEAYLQGSAFEEFIRTQQDQTLAVAAPLAGNDPNVWLAVGKVLTRRHSWLLFAMFLILSLTAVAVWQRFVNRRKENVLSEALAAANADARLNAEKLDHVKGDIAGRIEQEFCRWQLSCAERDVAMLMLKGLRLKEIASLRNTSERTVRQQALTIYKKAGLDGRSDLAAHFLEDFIGPPATN